MLVCTDSITTIKQQKRTLIPRNITHAPFQEWIGRREPTGESAAKTLNKLVTG